MSAEEQINSPWLSLRRLPDQTLRDAHRMQDVSYRMLFFAALGGCVIQIYFVLQTTRPSYRVLKMTMQLFRVLYYIPTFILAFRLRSYQRDTTSYSPNSYFLSIPALANLAFLSAVAAVCFSLVARTVVGQCHDDESMQACNPDEDYNSLPQDGVMAMLLVMLVSQILVKCYHRWALVVGWLACTASVLFCISYVTASRSHNTLLFCFVVGFIMFEYERHMQMSFAALQCVEQSIRSNMRAENEANVMEMRSVEMRHLLGNVAHDLKTPMQSFVMDIELMDKIINIPRQLTSAGGTELAAQDIRTLKDALQRLKDTNSFFYMIVNRAIDYAKTSCNICLTPKLADINFVDCIEWALSMMQAASSVPLIFEPVPQNIFHDIITDKQWLIENVLCLISNAAKFTSSGDVKVRCRVKEQQNPQLLIEVEDTGCGFHIDNALDDTLFEPSNQRTRGVGGTGLGLYSLRKRVEALQGTCGVGNRSDGAQGARVWFTIPYQPTKATIQEQVENGLELLLVSGNDNDSRGCGKCGEESLDFRDVLVVSPSPQQLRAVLVVDDSPMIRKTISRALCSEGLSVDVAENGEMALAMMALKEYDLVLMDFQMPVMDGLEATRRVRKQEEENCRTGKGSFRRLIIGISAYQGEPYESSAREAGIDDIIDKPFTVKRFFQVCRYHGMRLSSELASL